MLFSAYPVIKEMNSASLIFLVLLVYSTGLFGSGFFIRKSLPWTGDVFYIINLLATPVILASSSSLKFSEMSDFMIASLTVVIIPITSYITLKTLYKELQLGYFIVFILLALSSPLPSYIEISLNSAFFTREDFETFVSLLYFIVLLLGSLILNKNINIKNLKSTLFLNSLLTFVYMIIISTNNFSLQSYGMISMFLSTLLLFNIKKIQDNQNYSLFSKIEINTLKNLTSVGFLLSGIAPILSLYDITKLVIISFSGFVLYLLISDLFNNKIYKLINKTLNGIFYISFVILLLKSWEVSSDIQSFILSLTTLLLIIIGNNREFQKSKSILYFVSLTTSVIVWIKVSIFDSWSLYTIASLLILSFIYLFNSFYHKRNVLSYISVLTFSIVYFSLITVVNPYMDFYNYRYYAVLLSFLYLSVGYLIQLRYSDAKTSEKKLEEENAINLKKFFEKDIIRPYGLQDRFSSIIPYLISEPLYNFALLMTSISVLVNVKDYTIAILSSIFYICIFKVYPSRLWIYFAITASTDGFLNIITDVLPQKYQSWGFIILSFNWFFIGVIVEELFELYEREGKKLMYIDKKYAQPFFQGALIVNIFLLKYFFIDLLNINSEEGWLKIEQEFLQIGIISILYLLKMRAYISKLWLFPCMLVTSVVIFFKSISWLGAEYNLLIMTSIGFLWLGVGTLFNKSQKCVKYVKSIVDYKLPELDINGNYYKYHIYDFASPFYIFAFLSSFTSLFISVIMISKYSLLFATSLEFGISKLNILDINTFYFVQIINFVIIAVFFTIFYPKKILLLDGNYQDTVTPNVLNILPITSITMCFFWIYNFEITVNDINIFISAITLIWTLFYGFSEFLKKIHQGNYTHNKYYYYISLILGVFSFSFNTLILINPSVNQNSIYSFVLLLISFSILFFIKKDSYLIYFIQSILFISLYLYFNNFAKFEASFLIYFFALSNLFLQIYISDTSKNFRVIGELKDLFALSFLFTFNYFDEMTFYFALTGFILYLVNSFHNKLNFYPVLTNLVFIIGLYSLSVPQNTYNLIPLSIILYFISSFSIYKKLDFYPILSNLMFGLVLYSLSISKETYYLIPLSIIICFIAYFFILKIDNKNFNRFKQSMLFTIMLLLPSILFKWVFFSDRVCENCISYNSLRNYLFILLFSQTLLYGWIAYTSKLQVKSFCWWIIAISKYLEHLPLQSFLMP
ncbi:MAG: hypothetical protein U0354_04695 [Candidatus Sericytochromatia bacterium]